MGTDMARSVFYSFEYKPDNARAAQVRNMGVVEGNQPARDNDWETITKGGDKAIEKWIDDQLNGKSCTVVLIGQTTAGRKWITHEIVTSWNKNKGVLGLYIHKLKNLSGLQSSKGGNPFDHVKLTKDETKLSSFVKCYDPPYSDSQQAYSYIRDNIAAWIEDAVSLRAKY